uniref:Uncharacterized protein n=1 Tax=Panagrolaimus sp. ES5 TaxID=591445 RepID=A0AC34FW57_9BILA
MLGNNTDSLPPIIEVASPKDKPENDDDYFHHYDLNNDHGNYYLWNKKTSIQSDTGTESDIELPIFPIGKDKTTNSKKLQKHTNLGKLITFFFKLL